jgi:hypothetical protein
MIISNDLFFIFSSPYSGVTLPFREVRRTFDFDLRPQNQHDAGTDPPEVGLMLNTPSPSKPIKTIGVD